MVSRKPSAETGLGPAVQSLFRWWHRLVDRAAVDAVEAGTVLAQTAADDLRVARTGRTESLRRPSVVIFSVVMLGLGAALRIAVAAPGAERGAASIAALSQVVWAVARLAILGLTLRTLRRDPPAVRGAWALGNTAWVIAVDPLFAIIAWVASGGLTLWALRRLGEDRRSSRRAVTIAWGAQAAGAILGWLAINAWMGWVVSRG